MVMTALFKSNYFKTIFIPPIEIFEFHFIIYMPQAGFS